VDCLHHKVPITETKLLLVLSAFCAIDGQEDEWRLEVNAFGLCSNTAINSQ